jgi:hypothetical protein
MKIKEVKQIISKHKYKHYVYGIISPNGNPFYIGKGQKFRLQYHLVEALNTDNQNLKLNIIRGLVNSNKRLTYKLYGFYKTDEYALDVEKFLILYYGRIDLNTGILTNLTDGGGPRNCSSISIEKLRSSIKNYISNHPEEHKSYQKHATEGKRLPENREKYRQSQLDYMKTFPEEHAKHLAKTHKTRRKPENRKANSNRLKEYFKKPGAKEKNRQAQLLVHKRKRLVINRCKQILKDNKINEILPSTAKGIKVFEEFEKQLINLI